MTLDKENSNGSFNLEDINFLDFCKQIYYLNCRERRFLMEAELDFETYLSENIDFLKTTFNKLIKEKSE